MGGSGIGGTIFALVFWGVVIAGAMWWLDVHCRNEPFANRQYGSGMICEMR